MNGLDIKLQYNGKTVNASVDNSLIEGMIVNHNLSLEDIVVNTIRTMVNEFTKKEVK